MYSQSHLNHDFDNDSNLTIEDQWENFSNPVNFDHSDYDYLDDDGLETLNENNEWLDDEDFESFYTNQAFQGYQNLDDNLEEDHQWTNDFSIENNQDDDIDFDDYSWSDPLENDISNDDDDTSTPLTTTTNNNQVIIGNNIGSYNFKMGNDQDGFIIGTGTNNILLGGRGNEIIIGSDGNDYINGGEGNDHLVGGEGCNTYVFDQNFGHDTIDNMHKNLTEKDSIIFSKEWKKEDFNFSQQQQDLVISAKNSQDKLTIQRYFDEDGKHAVHEVCFSNQGVRQSLERHDIDALVNQNLGHIHQAVSSMRPTTGISLDQTHPTENNQPQIYTQSQ